MPNHVTNILRVSGDPEKVSAMFEAIKNDEIGLGSIDFNKIIPMPKALDIECGSRTDRAMKLYRAFREECAALALVHTLNPDYAARTGTTHDGRVAALVRKYEAMIKHDSGLLQLGERCYRNIKDYGHPAWYSWCNANWGTKWNSYGYHDYTEKDFDGSTIEFQTAWGCAFPVIETLAERYPDLHFELRWADEDFGYNVGEKEYEDGMEINSHIPNGGSKEALELAAEIHAVDLAEMGYLLNESTGEYEYHDPDESMSLNMQ